MSTKIYNAYWFDGTLEELVKHLQDYRPKWREFQVNRLTQMAENDNLGLMNLTSRIRDESTKTFPTWTDYYDVRGSVVVYPHDGYIYVQVFLDHKGPEFVDERFHDWHYQNQSDPWYNFDDSINATDIPHWEQEWEQRRKVWDEIFSTDNSTPAEAGLSYDVASIYDFAQIAEEVWKRNSPKKKEL